MGKKEQAIEKYRLFVERVDAIAAGIKKRHPEHFMCHPGCFSCCVPFSVLPVEAAVLQKGLKGLEEITSGDSGVCPLLTSDGLCAIYEQRPIICRTQGLPITSSEIEYAVDCCPLNFRGIPMEDLEKRDILNIDVLNGILVTLNAL